MALLCLVCSSFLRLRGDAVLFLFAWYLLGVSDRVPVLVWVLLHVNLLISINVLIDICRPPACEPRWNSCSPAAVF